MEWSRLYETKRERCQARSGKAACSGREAQRNQVVYFSYSNLLSRHCSFVAFPSAMCMRGTALGRAASIGHVQPKQSSVYHQAHTAKNSKFTMRRTLRIASVQRILSTTSTSACCSFQRFQTLDYSPAKVCFSSGFSKTAR